MADNDDEAVIETVNSVHVLGSVSASVSTDGQSGMLVFWIASEEGQGEYREEFGQWVRKFALTIPSDRFDALRRFTHGLMRGMIACSINPNAQEEILTAESFDPPFSIIITDPGRPEMLHLGMRHLTAAKLADLLQQSSMPKLTSDERADFVKWRDDLKRARETAKKQQVIAPPSKAFDVIPGSSIH